MTFGVIAFRLFVLLLMATGIASDHASESSGLPRHSVQKQTEPSSADQSDNAKPSSQEGTTEPDVIDRCYLRIEASGAHCGIYSVGAAIKALGGDVSAHELVKQCKISSPKGCSASDIVKMVEAFGYRATVIDKISGATLAFSDTPIIVHLDGQRTVEKTQHWVCVLGIRDGTPLLFDPPHRPEKVDYGEVLAYTSGLGIAVSKKSDQPRLHWFGKIEMLFWLFVCSLALITATRVMRLFRPSPNGHLKMRYQYGAFVFAIGITIFIQQMLPWSTFLRDRVTLGHFQEIYASATEPDEIPVEEFLNGIKNHSFTIIDARLPAAYGARHIPNAVNWPVDASMIESRNVLQRLDLSKPVVVYCESDRCGWSDAIAIRLSKRGVKNVRIFRGGYQEWLAHSK